MEEEEKTRCEAAGNAGRGGHTQVVVAVEISRGSEACVRSVTSEEEEDGDIRMRDLKVAKGTNGLEASYHAITDGSHNTNYINVDSTK